LESIAFRARADLLRPACIRFGHFSKILSKSITVNCPVEFRAANIENPSQKYLASYLKSNEKGDVPAISLECVMKSAGLIEQMGRGRLKPRKEREG
jgi:hypothetical protein